MNSSKNKKIKFYLSAKTDKKRQEQLGDFVDKLTNELKVGLFLNNILIILIVIMKFFLISKIKFVFKRAEFTKITFENAERHRKDLFNPIYSDLMTSEVVIYVYWDLREFEREALLDESEHIGESEFDEDFFRLHYCNNRAKCIDITIMSERDKQLKPEMKVKNVPNFAIPSDFPNLALELMKTFNYPGTEERTKGLFKRLCNLFLRAFIFLSYLKAKRTLVSSLGEYRKVMTNNLENVFDRIVYLNNERFVYVSGDESV